MEHFTVQTGDLSDLPALDALYPEAFPDEDLVPLVAALLRAPAGVLSLVATEAQRLIGHALFTECRIAGSECPAALLGPVAVAPNAQHRGIGRTLIERGVRQMRESGTAILCVLGDPAYYARLGFKPEADIRPPYPLPPEWDCAWQSIRLRKDPPVPAGVLSVPAPWRQRALWSLS